MTTGTGFHLAQVNIARLRGPLDSPLLAEFVEWLDPINALADGSPGFVWRLQTEDGNATAVTVFDDGGLIVNMSVWESLEDLRNYVYASGHIEVMRRRREWFERMVESHMALWWLPAGDLPSVDDAEERLRHLREQGPTPYAFTFREHFPPPGEDSTVTVEDDGWACPIGE